MKEKANVKNMLSIGRNMKIGSNVAIFNISAIRSCPNCSSCASTCYAFDTECYRKNVKEFRKRNWDISKTDLFVPEMIRQIVKSKKKIVRIHESGDFYDPSYIFKWSQIISALPKVKFFGFTKVEDALVLNVFKNCNIIYSFITCGDEEIRNYGKEDFCKKLAEVSDTAICPHDKTWKKKGKKCMIDCKKCLRAKRMIFVIHGNKKKKDKYADQRMAVINALNIKCKAI